MRVLMLTYRIDQSDWQMGFAHDWVEVLANHPRVEQLDVICLHKGEVNLPNNVTLYSMGKEKGYSRLREGVTYLAHLRHTLPKADILFGHMIPRYTLIAGPFAKLLRVPIVQWYTHRNVTRELRLVYRMASRVVTASPESFRIPGDKVTVLGHGIDMSKFSPAPTAQADVPTIVAVGRLSPIKNFDALIKAVADLKTRPEVGAFHVKIVGGPTEEHGTAYANHLRHLIEIHDVADQVALVGPVPHDEVVALNREAALSINLCPTGGLDKVVLEGMATATPVVAHNETFLPLFAADGPILHAPTLEPALIADRIAAILTLPETERRALGDRLRERIQETYALENLVERLVTIFEEVQS